MQETGDRVSQLQNEMNDAADLEQQEARKRRVEPRTVFIRRYREN